MADASGKRTSPPDDDSRESSEQIFREVVGRIEAGEKVDPEEYFTRYPELEDELRRLFDGSKQGEPDEAKSLDRDRVLGDFKIVDEIAHGAMGVVFEAEQLSIRRRVALKVLPKHLRMSETAVRRFKREAEAIGRLNHPGIVAIYGVGEQEGVHYIAQELVEGGFSLSDRLDELKKVGDQPPVALTLAAH